MPLPMSGLRVERCKFNSKFVFKAMNYFYLLSRVSLIAIFLTLIQIPHRCLGRQRHPFRRRLMERRRGQPLRLPQATQPPQAAKPLTKSPSQHRRLDVFLQLRRPSIHSRRPFPICLLRCVPNKRLRLRWPRP
jgi:hypothetical protein